MINQIKQLLAEDLKNLEQYLSNVTSSDVYLLEKLLSGSMAGGKRVRPMLLYLTSHMLGYTGELTTIVAAAIEEIHVASLLHDDVIDGAQMRRGKTSANSLFGSNTAVLAGDYLFTTSFLSVLNIPDEFLAVNITKILSHSIAEMSKGEIFQLSVAGNVNITEKEYHKIIFGKTAALFAGTCKCAALLAGISKDKTDALYNFGLNTGIAFQLRDDILDYFGKENNLGKKIGSDLSENKMTLPLLLLRDTVGAEIIQNLFDSNSDINAKMSELGHHFVSHDIEKKAFGYMQKYIDDALKYIDIFDNNEYKMILCGLVDVLKHRSN